MKFFLLANLFCVLIAASGAAEAIGYFQNQFHNGKCVILGRVLSPGDEQPIDGICGKMFCGRNSRITFQTCGVSPFVNNRKSHWPYPLCCIEGEH